MLEEFPHPEGQLKNQEIESDKQGRCFDSVGRARHATGRDRRATEHVADQFASRLARTVEQHRVEHRFGQLVLVADRRFLGKLRQTLTPQTLRLVSGSLDKDLFGFSERDLVPHVAHLLGREAIRKGF